MEANRAVVIQRIMTGLEKSDAEYPLIRAELDLDALKRAGSIPGAISGITASADDTKAAALAATPTSVRDAAFVATLPTRQNLSDRVTQLADAAAIALANKELPTVSLINDPGLRAVLSQESSGGFGVGSGSRAKQFLQTLIMAGPPDQQSLQKWDADLTAVERS